MNYEAWRISYQSSEQAARAAYAECERLRAKVAEIERQEPVFWWRPCSDGTYEGPLHNNSIERVRKLSGAWSPLYALPGAQLAPSVSAELLDRAIDTIGRFCSDEGWMQSDMDTLDALIAASEAKP